LRKELLIVAVVIALLIVAEATLRMLGPTLSENIRISRAAAAQAIELAQQPPPRVLILGNSLTAHGIDTPQFAGEMRRLRPTGLSHTIVTLNGAELTEWRWLAQSRFISPGRSPEVVVINTSARGLSDDRPVDHRRLALHFDAWQRPLVPAADLPQFDRQCEFALSRASLLFNRAQLLGTQLKQRVVPHYQQGVAWTNAATASAADAERPDVKPLQFGRLQRLASLAKEHDMRLIVCLMPRREPDPISPELWAALRASAVELIDLREAGPLQPGDFLDNAHLGRGGAKKFTPRYAAELARRLR
jgi:hypothetical protein